MARYKDALGATVPGSQAFLYFFNVLSGKFLECGADFLTWNMRDLVHIVRETVSLGMVVLAHWTLVEARSQI